MEDMSKTYDFQKAKTFIENNQDSIKVASLGMYEDWFWTAETVYEDGEWKVDLDELKTVGGIENSHWATPTLRVEYEDGNEECIPVYKGKSEASQPPFPNLGVLSSPVQSNMPNFSFKEDV